MSNGYQWKDGILSNIRMTLSLSECCNYTVSSSYKLSYSKEEKLKMREAQDEREARWDERKSKAFLSFSWPRSWKDENMKLKRRWKREAENIKLMSWDEMRSAKLNLLKLTRNIQRKHLKKTFKRKHLENRSKGYKHKDKQKFSTQIRKKNKRKRI